MFNTKEITKKILTQFRKEHGDERLVGLDTDISTHLFGIYDGDQMIGVCEFLDTSITTKVLHISMIFMIPEYQNPEYLKLFIQHVIQAYSKYAITIHPQTRLERGVFIELGFSYDTSFYLHESNTVKHLPWYTNTRSEKMLIAL
jgi:predicted GNAT family N-acyltransferase